MRVPSNLSSNLRLVILFALLLLEVLIPQSDGATITPKHSRRFSRYENCQFVSTAFADGDSFQIRIGEDEFVFRLYYVDAPESDERFPERNAEQAEYFGLTPEESLAAGKAAKKYVQEVLAGKTLTVFTRWSSALGSSRLPRYYAVIEVEGRGLAELLVENGFARLHGVSVNHPSGIKGTEYVVALEKLEESAREMRAGAWSQSRPEKQRPTIEEDKETWEISRSMDRLAFAGLGAGGASVLWMLTLIVRKRSRSRLQTTK